MIVPVKYTIAELFFSDNKLVYNVNINYQLLFVIMCLIVTDFVFTISDLSADQPGNPDRSKQSS
jgi:hypothetical protein